MPAGYAFGIWGLITALTVAYAIGQMRTPRSTTAVDRVAGPLALVCAGFVLWLAAAANPEASPFVTPVIFACMYVFLLVGMRRFRDAPDGSYPRGLGILAQMTLGLYAGWTGVAVWVNLSTSITDLSASASASIGQPSGTLWQLALVLVATAGTLLTAVYFRSRPVLQASLGGAAVWALVAAAVGAGGVGAGLLTVAAAGASALVSVSCVALALGARRRLPESAG